MELDTIVLGNNIRKYRNAARLRQEDLAEKCDCSNSFIGQMENGKASPSLKLIVRLANALGVTVDQLLVEHIEHSELVHLRRIEERIDKLPTSARIIACEELSNLLCIIERVHNS